MQITSQILSAFSLVAIITWWIVGKRITKKQDMLFRVGISVVMACSVIVFYLMD